MVIEVLMVVMGGVGGGKCKDRWVKPASRSQAEWRD